MDNKSNTFFRKNICSDSDVSNRANNICRKNKLKTIADLIAYKRNHGDFKNLRGCGPKSNIELLALCKKYEKLYRSKGNGVLNMAVDLGEKNGSEILEESKVERVKVEEVMAHAQRRKDRLDGYFSNQASMDKMWKDNMMLLQTKIQEFVINLSRKAYKALSVQLNHDFSIHNFYFQFETSNLYYF